MKVRFIGEQAIAAAQLDSPDTLEQRIHRAVQRAARRRAEADLKWFFTEADGDQGMRGASLEPGAGREESDRAADRRHDACIRYSEVAFRLRKIGPGYARVLGVAYTPFPWPAGLARWYELAGVAALLVERREAPAALVAAHRAIRHEDDDAGSLVRAGSVLAALADDAALDMRRAAAKALRAALAAYVEAS